MSLTSRIRKLHVPVTEEAEFFYDDEPTPHCDRTCTYRECPGHIVEVQVCQECGYDTDEERVVYRSWPCPTIRATQRRPWSQAVTLVLLTAAFTVYGWAAHTFVGWGG